MPEVTRPRPPKKAASSGKAMLTSVFAPRRPAWARRAHKGLILTEAGETLLVQLRIRDRATLLSHPRLAEPAVGFQQPIVALALDDVPARRPVFRRRALRPVAYHVGPAHPR